MTLEFKDAEYIPPAGGPGRVAEPNPFGEIVQAIAMKKDAKDKPLSKALEFEHPSRLSDKSEDAATLKQTIARFKRQLSDAGDAATPKVTVKSVVTPVRNPNTKKDSPTKSTLTFWTIARQLRPRKPKTETAK